MPPAAQQPDLQRVEQIVAAVGKLVKGNQAKSAAAFVRAYYDHAPAEELTALEAGEAAAAALSLWRWAAVRLRGTVLVRAFNPERAQHGWHCPRTVIEIANDDMPLLVDSVLNELARQGLPVQLIIHPVVRVSRLANGRLVRVSPADCREEVPGRAESCMHVEIAQQAPERFPQIIRGLKQVLGDVRAAVADEPKIRARLQSTIADLEAATASSLSESDRAECQDFLRWLAQDNYTFLGYREYRFLRQGEQLVADALAGADLGLLRRRRQWGPDVCGASASWPAGMQQQSGAQPRLLWVGKGPRKATVHRDVFVDVVCVRQFDGRGRVTGARVFVGLFTADAYRGNLQSVPVLRRRVATVLSAARLQPNSHDGRALRHILETFPRDDLFQISDDDLYSVATRMLRLRDRNRASLFVWQDPFQRFVSGVVCMPFERYHLALWQRIQRMLEESFTGVCQSYDTLIDRSAEAARIHFVLEVGPGRAVACDSDDLERRIDDAVRAWPDRLRDALVAAVDEGECRRLLGRYREAFDGAYQVTHDSGMAVRDVQQIERALGTGVLQLHVYRRADQRLHELRMRAYHPRQPMLLSDALPILENFGFQVRDERPSLVRPQDGPVCWVHDFGLARHDGAEVDLDAMGTLLQDAVIRVWSREMEDDGFNRLVAASGLAWRQVVVLRAYARFLRQARVPFSDALMQSTLARHPRLTRLVVALFETQFDPAGDRAAARVDELRQAIQQELEAVTILDEDRILRTFIQVVEGTLRTNYYQRTSSGGRKPYLALKLASRSLDFLPPPRPMVEVFVYSPAMEGVHLRFGAVARGGLRWSDRRDDFRTEVLGLSKTQQIKNAIIVPVGSKGGFVVKRPPADGSREAQMQAGTECYRTLIRGLLDVTDNYRDGLVVHPEDVVCRDGDDPYLVVAADKGTASFSDVANAVAAEYGFWLGDAFASGGSAGYDHKKMGITARGAWESVKRHFRELGKDVQREDFTVVGVGDMSGDVFGNGMLQSRHIRLVAAFNHRHIFLDPDPDPARSYRERERLFGLPRSNWSDYDPAALSAGGAVYERNVKSVTLSEAARERLGIDQAELTPDALIQAILCAPVDLLFFGGIGTFVRGRQESDAEVGDRANDALRVAAGAVRATVIAEGANLGVTQLGRVEFALGGGRINTDSIDNSGGVDCSDHEVNIKILLQAVERDGQLTRVQRDELLNLMTDDVAQLVLRDNYLQTGRLSIASFHAPLLTDRLAAFLRALERAGHLDRSIERLPGDEVVAARKARGQGFTRPELSVLMAYAKIVHYRELVDSTFLDEPHLERVLEEYFPPPLSERYRPWMLQHRLRREIVATMITNLMVNRVGITFIHELQERTGEKVCGVARAFTVAAAVFDMHDLWSAIDALDYQVSAAAQAAMHGETSQLVEHVTDWFLRHESQPLEMGRAMERYAADVRSLGAGLELLLAEPDRQDVAGRAAALVREGVPESLARRVSLLRPLMPACDIVRLSQESGRDVAGVAALYFAVGERLELEWLRRAAAALPVESQWDSQAAAAIIGDLYQCQSLLARQLLRQADQPDDDPAAILRRSGEAFLAMSQWIKAIRRDGTVSLAVLAVASRQLRALVTD